MEKSANVVQKCLPIPTVDDYGIDRHCVFQEVSEEWQELEQFWEDPRHKFQDFEKPSQHPLSSSLERHLLFDDCLQAPYEEEEPIKDFKEDTYCLNDSESVVRGEDINDIPTLYTVTGFRPNELIVIGTYVDKRVIPGFKYVVRKNLSDKYLFGGKPLKLEQIGLGYGKRITFEGPSLNKNCNYFWSDSCPAGYGFYLSILSSGDVFGIYDNSRQQYCGRITVTGIKQCQVVKSIDFGENGKVEKTVDVEFTCDVIYVDCTNKQTLVVQDIVAAGTASVIRERHFAAAEIKHIELSRFVIDNCLLKPEN